MVLFPRNRPPRFRRSLSGTFDVVVKERFEGGFLFEIVDLDFRSIEDDLYEVVADSGVIRLSYPEILLNSQMWVNEVVADYHSAMLYPDRELLANTWPPVFQNFGMISSENERGQEYWLHVFAEASFCPADCNQDGVSTIDELLACLNVALGLADTSTCPTCDLNGDGGVSIDEVVVAVDTVLHGCR
jgi:hypothetical protein